MENSKEGAEMIKRIAFLIAGILVGGSGVWLAGRARTVRPRLDAPFQAVLLDNGQVYFGKVSGLGSAFPVIQNVYYIQRGTNPETREASNVLIRRGYEWHGPESTMISASHIVMVEPVGPNSRIAQLIAEQEKRR